MSDTTYNGWVNRATWGVNLILSNDEAHYNAITEYAADAFMTVYTLADLIREYVEDVFDNYDDIESRSDLLRQLVFDSLASVDFIEIAKGFME